MFSLYILFWKEFNNKGKGQTKESNYYKGRHTESAAADIPYCFCVYPERK